MSNELLEGLVAPAVENGAAHDGFMDNHWNDNQNNGYSDRWSGVLWDGRFSLIDVARHTARASTIFGANDNSATTRRRKAGRLDPGKYRECLTGDQHVFYKRRAPRGLSRRVIMTLDMSGSMWARFHDKTLGENTRENCPSRYEHMSRLVILMAELCRSQNVAFEVYGCDGIRMTAVSIDQDVDNLADVLTNGMSPGGGNSDQYILNAALHMAWRRPETDILVMHFSDGGFYFDPFLADLMLSHYEHASMRAEEKRVRLVGVGIEDTNMSRYGLDTINLPCVDYEEDVDHMLAGLTDRLGDPDEPQRPTALAVKSIIECDPTLVRRAKAVRTEG